MQLLNFKWEISILNIHCVDRRPFIHQLTTLLHATVFFVKQIFYVQQLHTPPVRFTSYVYAHRTVTLIIDDLPFINNYKIEISHLHLLAAIRPTAGGHKKLNSLMSNEYMILFSETSLHSTVYISIQHIKSMSF